MHIFDYVTHNRRELHEQERERFSAVNTHLTGKPLHHSFDCCKNATNMNGIMRMFDAAKNCILLFHFIQQCNWRGFFLFFCSQFPSSVRWAKKKVLYAVFKHSKSTSDRRSADNTYRNVQIGRFDCIFSFYTTSTQLTLNAYFIIYI